MKIRLFAGAAAVTASLFLSQASIGVAAEPLVLTPAQMDAVAAGLSVKVDVKAKAVGNETKTNTDTKVRLIKNIGYGIGIAIARSDEDNGASTSIDAAATGDKVSIKRKSRTYANGKVAIGYVKVRAQDKR